MYLDHSYMALQYPEIRLLQVLEVKQDGVLFLAASNIPALVKQPRRLFLIPNFKLSKTKCSTILVIIVDRLTR